MIVECDVLLQQNVMRCMTQLMNQVLLLQCTAIKTATVRERVSE